MSRRLGGGHVGRPRGVGADREAVLAAVETFFRTITARDPARARAVLVPEGRFFSIRPGPDGKWVITSGAYTVEREGRPPGPLGPLRR